MDLLARLLFALAVVVAPIVIWATSAQLPASVASHFGAGGHADGFMRHGVYVAFMLAMSTLLPLVIVAAAGLVPRGDRALRATTTQACIMGTVLAVFLAGVHFLILDANAHTPPRLNEPAFYAATGAFAVSLATWIGIMLWRRRRGGA
jgi:hypothetical protein